MNEEEAASPANTSCDYQVQNLVREIRSQTRLHWNYCHLKSLPPELTEEGLYIEQIHLKCNALTRLPDNFGRLEQLTCCYLNSNKLESLPDSIGDLKVLTVLDVGNNELRTLPPSLGKLPCLRSLVVVHNRLTAFPPELCNLRSLSILMLSGNQLTSLPSAMDGMRGLMGLYLDHNRLRELPRSLAELPVLARISCFCNRITHLPALPFVARPKIYFDSNAVNYLPFSMVRQLKEGASWYPIILPTCSFNPKVAMDNNTVIINISTHAQAPALVLPPQIRGVSEHVTGHYNVPPLKELCLSLIYGSREWPTDIFVSSLEWKYYFPLKEPNVLPKVLLDALGEGPLAWCDYLYCQKSIFTYATILVVPISVTPREDFEVHEIPMLLYFCSDHCVVQLRKYCENNCENMFMWLADRMKHSLDIEIV